MSLPVATIIAVAKSSQYLSANDISKGSLFGARKIPITPRILYTERRIIEYIYGLDTTDSALRLTANYLYSLCRGYNLQALNIVNAGGGGGVSPITPSFAPAHYDFIVTSSSFIVTGQSVKVFPSSWIGWDIIFFRGTTVQSITVPDFGDYYSWDSATATLTMLAVGGADPSAQADERFQIYPSGGSGVASPSTSGGVLSPIRITGANFANATDWNGANSDSVTVLPAYTLQVFFNDINRFLDESTEWQRTASGVQILLPGFNATTTNLTSVFYIYISP